MCASEITFGYLLCPVIRRSAEARFWGFYHGFGDVFRRFGLFLAWAPSGDSPKAGSTKWEKSVEELEKTCRLSLEDASGSEYLQ